MADPQRPYLDEFFPISCLRDYSEFAAARCGLGRDGTGCRSMLARNRLPTPEIFG